ncbi:hypothetical protein T492DRAFT_173490 [Pavlovales sp. CCMP2436]|nr:hypothetical protein T492DRAFT_173490 [Pavlovales sp. CCMP2436]
MNQLELYHCPACASRRERARAEPRSSHPVRARLAGGPHGGQCAQGADDLLEEGARDDGAVEDLGQREEQPAAPTAPPARRPRPACRCVGCLRLGQQQGAHRRLGQGAPLRLAQRLRRLVRGREARAQPTRRRSGRVAPVPCSPLCPGGRCSMRCGGLGCDGGRGERGGLLEGGEHVRSRQHAIAVLRTEGGGEGGVGGYVCVWGGQSVKSISNQLCIGLTSNQLFIGSTGVCVHTSN